LVRPTITVGVQTTQIHTFAGSSHDGGAEVNLVSVPVTVIVSVLRRVLAAITVKIAEWIGLEGQWAGRASIVNVEDVVVVVVNIFGRV
jgi:hypothetical protein